MVVAMLALFVALSGTAVATTSALITGKQIKNSSITGLDIKNESVTARDIKGRLRGAPGARGPLGAQGPQGPQGVQGPAGQAVAYARVTGAGTLLPTDPAFAGQHKNVAPGNITHAAGTGIYCFDVAFTPNSAMVVSDNLNALPADENNWIVSVALYRGASLESCAGADARVVTTHVDGAAANEDHGFIIWFE